MEHLELDSLFNQYKETSLSGRYVHLDHIMPLLDRIGQRTKVEILGKSENQLPIHLITIGTGKKKLLFWSQMHGNESTTTKAVFDLLNVLLDDENIFGNTVLKECTLYIVPILSPDGARAYTRLNYNQVDLNRDAQNRTQSESIILHNLIDQIKPDVAFNLHGQRTIFSTGNSNYPATVSFLSPAGNKERTITDSRKKAMEVIVHMNKALQAYIPNQIGRYDDGFNINCIGDTLTHMEIPAILFEAGHYPKDYNREKTREYIFYALITALNYISDLGFTGEEYNEYFQIPENGKCFYDIIIRDVILDGKNVDIAIQYTEQLEVNHVKFVPKIVKIDNLQGFYGHREIKGKKRSIFSENDRNLIVPESELLKFYLDSELFLTELGKS